MCVKHAEVGLNIFVSVMERQRVILEMHDVITQLSCKGTVVFGLVGPPIFMLAGMCVTWLHFSRFVDITPWP